MTSTGHIIHVQPEGDGAPADVRIRRSLKTALRQHSLRCTGVSEIPTPSTAWRAVTNSPQNRWRNIRNRDVQQRSRTTKENR